MTAVSSAANPNERISLPCKFAEYGANEVPPLVDKYTAGLPIGAEMPA